MAQSKAELVDELETQATKADLVELLRSKLLKDDLAKLLDDESGATKEELVHKLGSLKKDELVDAVARKLSKDDIEKVVTQNREDDEEDADEQDEQKEQDDPQAEEERDEPEAEEEQNDPQAEEERDEPEAEEEQDEPKARKEEDDEGDSGDRQRGREETAVARRDESTDIDWSAELDWAPPPRPTPAPVTFVGAAPFQPGQRVRVDVAGLPMLGVFAGKGASAAGTIVGVDAQARMVKVFLDAIFDGEKEIVVPPERIQPDG